MPVGESNFERLKSGALKWHPESAERAAWAQVFFSLLTQARYKQKSASTCYAQGIVGGADAGSIISAQTRDGVA